MLDCKIKQTTQLVTKDDVINSIYLWLSWLHVVDSFLSTIHLKNYSFVMNSAFENQTKKKKEINK